MSAHKAKDSGFTGAQQGAACFGMCLIAFVTLVSIARGHVAARTARSLDDAAASTLRMAALDGEIAVAHFAGNDRQVDALVTLAE